MLQHHVKSNEHYINHLNDFLEINFIVKNDSIGSPHNPTSLHVY
jgi:hypothetical protein